MHFSKVLKSNLKPIFLLYFYWKIHIKCFNLEMKGSSFSETGSKKSKYLWAVIDGLFEFTGSVGMHTIMEFKNYVKIDEKNAADWLHSISLSSTGLALEQALVNKGQMWAQRGRGTLRVMPGDGWQPIKAWISGINRGKESNPTKLSSVHETN